MPSPDAIAIAIGRMIAAGLSPPAPERIVAETWLDALQALDDAQLDHAARAHLRDPERGSYWPTPADLLRLCPATARSPAQLDGDAFDRLITSIRGGSPSHSHMDPDQRAALDRIGLGSTWDQRRMEESRIPHRRRDFVAECAAVRERRAAQLDAPPPLKLVRR